MCISLFTLVQIMRQRADEHGVAEVRWLDMTNADGSHIGVASGDWSFYFTFQARLSRNLLPILHKTGGRMPHRGSSKRACDCIIGFVLVYGS